jgi:hypothetical protein
MFLLYSIYVHIVTLAFSIPFLFFLPPVHIEYYQCYLLNNWRKMYTLLDIWCRCNSYLISYVLKGNVMQSLTLRRNFLPLCGFLYYFCHTWYLMEHSVYNFSFFRSQSFYIISVSCIIHPFSAVAARKMDRIFPSESGHIVKIDSWN